MPRNVDPGSIKKGSGYANQDSVDSNSFTDEVAEGSSQGLDSHVNAGAGAHPASAISTTTSNGAYFGIDVQANLDELAGIIPPQPPTVGNFSTALTFSGIPDWGQLKLLDGGFVARGDVTPPDANNPTNDFFVYREFFWPPFEAQNVLTPANPPGDVFTVAGNDPDTDPVFNVAALPGGGPGVVHQGGFTRGAPVIETARVRDVATTETNVSGALFPADRGVLALFHWPPGGGIPDFLAQPLTDRVVAAILCGQGLSGDCDGDPGGIFSEGDPDVFAFPGRATGQYDLVEIHSGTDNQTGDPLPAGPEPAAGQVRLGTDPAAGPVVVGGIPILGATSIATGGGTDTNFFRYRLPHLSDYSSATGLVFTPTIQKPRYFEKPAISLDPGIDLTQAGNYEDFALDYRTYQVSRYRHQFDVTAGDAGSYLMLHFRREQDFEAFARDGIMPDDASLGYELWSASMVNYANPESVDNLVDTSNPLSPLTSEAYHLHRSALFTQVSPVLSANTLTYDFDREVDEVMYSSGVRYFLPNGSGVGTNWQINELTLSLNDLFNDGYRLGFNAGSTDITPGLTHANPAILYLGAATASQNIVNGLGAGYTGTAFYQRVDFDYTDLDSLSGPFDLATGPAPADTADIVLLGGDTPITFSGDDDQCHFWFDARVRAFARRPPAQGAGLLGTSEFLFPNPGAVSLLMHTTSHSPSLDSGGSYGNFKVAAGDNPPRPSLVSPRKDVEERFYDEVYRVAASELQTIDSSFNLGLGIGNLVGPGLPFPASPIELPTRIGDFSVASFGAASFLRRDFHLEDLSASVVVEDEAQVSGLPDRSPPASDGVENPCPFSGMLIYPQIDYSTGFRPSLADGDISSAQPDYSGVADPERVYIRIFDAAYFNEPSNDDKEPGVVGQPFLTFRIDGLELEDFAYSAPGPGSDLIALEVKIPGLTTWMDIGRRDMDGPSKQDPLVDGAGCQVVDPTLTFNGRDATTGTVYCQVRINVGPAANVFANTGLNPLAPLGEAPVMVRARVKALGASLNFTQSGSASSSATPRALAGITVLRHSNGLGPNDANPYGPPALP